MTSPEIIRPIEGQVQPETVVEGPIDIAEQQAEQGAPTQWVPQQPTQPPAPIPTASDDTQSIPPVVVPIATETAEAYAAAPISDSKKWFGVAILRIIKRAFASGRRVVVGGN